MCFEVQRLGKQVKKLATVFYKWNFATDNTDVLR